MQRRTVYRWSFQSSQETFDEWVAGLPGDLLSLFPWPMNASVMIAVCVEPDPPRPYRWDHDQEVTT